MEIIQVEIKELRANPKNPRRISKAELKKLIRSITEFGFVDPVIVNKHKERYNIIIGGHQRVRAAKRMGMKQVPVHYVELDENKENLLNIALNEISGEWDDQKLFQLMSELKEKDVDLTLTGFDEPFIDEILAADNQREKDALIDIAPLPPEKPKSKLGEVYILGDHRIICGDATDPEVFKKLMNDQKGDMCWMDPPLMSNDELRGDDLFKFLLGFYSNLNTHMKDKAALYSCYASVNHIIFEKAINEAGFTVKQQLIWEKGHVLGHSDYHWCHEPILYCRKKDHNTEWFGDRTHKTAVLGSTIEQLEEMHKEKLIEIISKIREQSDIIHIRKDAAVEYLHSTQKPVELSKTIIKNSSRPKDIVIDPCAGSGSTLMACETSGRRCYAAEIEPKYVDVVLNRYKNYTGKDPVREDGKKWSEI